MDEQDWAAVVRAAIRAPSIHNTQPWWFTATPDRLELHLDRERALPVLDPTGRQQVISCGVAAEFAAVALRASGVEPTVDLLPDPADPDHLATVHAGPAREVTAEDRALAEAIGRRHTERAPFQPRAVPDELVDRVQADAGRLGVWLKPINESEEEVATVFLISRAEEIERSDPGYVAELQRWLRTDPAAVDGVPVEAVPSEDPATRPSNWLIRDFVVGSRGGHSAFLPEGDATAPPPAVERPTVVLLGTDNDDRTAWLLAGRALGRLLLEATTHGLAASPLTQALDWPATRARMRTRLSLVGHPQMLLRMGYPSTEGAPHSGRRPVAEVLRYSTAG
ncbi:Acg family FMN-binding oxidoreductase [Geodermatophilus sabuli]|uniref:Nitroreductase family protein n=1 Tax=Geodermatophilus sabuli TaxID=1564158 RepID=A0A285E899_9ACTN|nr:nitroreductase family protein [Geodermatophilus sabuli]MBB3081891.1 nitroreductase [Geodermatophilus sabuli]SNX95237.1 Nitroreductase family protein [Geodermatophilus sabuli]